MHLTEWKRGSSLIKIKSKQKHKTICDVLNYIDRLKCLTKPAELRNWTTVSTAVNINRIFRITKKNNTKKSLTRLRRKNYKKKLMADTFINYTG